MPRTTSVSPASRLACQRLHHVLTPQILVLRQPSTSREPSQRRWRRGVDLYTCRKRNICLNPPLYRILSGEGDDCPMWADLRNGISSQSSPPRTKPPSAFLRCMLRTLQRTFQTTPSTPSARYSALLAFRTMSSTPPSSTPADVRITTTPAAANDEPAPGPSQFSAFGNGIKEIHNGSSLLPAGRVKGQLELIVGACRGRAQCPCRSSLARCRPSSTRTRLSASSRRSTYVHQPFSSFPLGAGTARG